MLFPLMLSLSLLGQVNVKDLSDPCPHLKGDEYGRKLIKMSEDDTLRRCCGCPPNHRLVKICKLKQYNTTQCEKCEDGTYIPDKLHDKTTCLVTDFEPPTTKSPASDIISFGVGVVSGVIAVLVVIGCSKSPDVSWKKIFCSKCSKRTVNHAQNQDGMYKEENIRSGNTNGANEAVELLEIQRKEEVEAINKNKSASSIQTTMDTAHGDALPAYTAVQRATVIKCTTKENIDLLKKAITVFPYKHKHILLTHAEGRKLARMLGIGEIDSDQISKQHEGDVVQYFVSIVTHCQNRKKDFTVKQFIDKMKELQMNCFAETLEKDLLTTSSDM